MENRTYLILFILLGTFTLYGQVDPQVLLYRDDQRGNFKYERESIMDGNLVRTLFKNTTEVAHWPFQPSGEWPKGSGHPYIDGVTVLIAAQITTATGQVIHSVEASYREEMDSDPTTGEIWGLEPLPGYANSSSTKPAMSIDKSSWPLVWPKATFRYDYPTSEADKWNGHWYGYFGLDQKNADFETFFVVDDNRDGEYRRAPYSYFPIKSDTTWGGLGLRVETRGFQWSHVLAEDIIFWHYDIVNVSDYDYDSTCFGFYSDPGVGGPSSGGDDVRYDKYLDLTYAWDHAGKGVPGNWITGYYGYAYLESPGNATNGIDDDEDGMIDERRDDGIDNDHDWVPYLDVNNNGKWDPLTEPLNNDVGKDGVGPYDIQYTGPDEGEGDGKPTDGEPNFDKTDKDESDQIGLNSVSLVNLAHTPSNPWPKYDEVVWTKMLEGFADTSIANTNVNIVFSSGPFPLKKGLRERYSMALVFGSDKEDMIFNKVTVQQIYNANYNFAKPPITPKLTAVAGDKKVFLYWDKKAEESRDPFLGFEYDKDGNRAGFKKDFEGYLVYKSREPEFQDIKVITDSKGEPKYWKPIAQFDLVDSMLINGVKVAIEGPDPVGINGARFWRGSQTGLQNSYVDTDVKNGETYYYAIVSYDMGDPKFGTTGLQPSECTKIISVDYAGNLQFVDVNCAVVVPNAPASGYIPPEVVGDLKHVSSGIGTGSLLVNVLNPDEVLNGASYKVKFNTDTLLYQYTTKSFDVIRTYQGTDSPVLTGVDSSFFGATKMSQPFDGLSVSVTNDTAIALDVTKTGWVKGQCNANITVTQNISSTGVKWPADYEFEFYDHIVDTTDLKDGAYVIMPINFKVKNITEGRYVKIAMSDPDKSGTLSVGDEVRILEYKGSLIRTVWSLFYSLPWNPTATPIDPAPGDVFRIATIRPFFNNDAFIFVTKTASVSNDKAKTDLEKISVVPNPYLGAASWEKRNLNFSGRGERKIDFINLPAKCELRIYTMSGYLVKTLYKDSMPGDGSLSWNLVSEDGMDIAYGIYVYHVKAEGIGEHIGKFAVIK